MEEIIMNNGFKKDDYSNDYIRGDWTIRIDNEFIEVFNNPEKSIGKYYIIPLLKVDITELLKELNEL